MAGYYLADQAFDPLNVQGYQPWASLVGAKDCVRAAATFIAFKVGKPITKIAMNINHIIFISFL